MFLDAVNASKITRRNAKYRVFVRKTLTAFIVNIDARLNIETKKKKKVRIRGGQITFHYVVSCIVSWPESAYERYQSGTKRDETLVLEVPPQKGGGTEENGDEGTVRLSLMNDGRLVNASKKTQTPNDSSGYTRLKP